MARRPDRIYAATDVFLLTSANEGTPVALIEAMASGVAGVSTDVGGVGDVISSESVGLLAPAGNVEGLARAVATLLADPSRRAAIGAAGRASVLSRYGLERLESDVVRVYRELLQGDSDLSINPGPAKAQEQSHAKTIGPHISVARVP